MNKILIINTKSDRDLIGHTALLSKLSLHNEITLLTTEELGHFVGIFKCFSNIIKINTKEISNIFENKLFLNTLALEKLHLSLEPLKNQSWNLIINLSNNKLSALLASYLKNSATDLFGFYWELGLKFSHSKLMSEEFIESAQTLGLGTDQMLSLSLQALKGSCILENNELISKKLKKHICHSRNLINLENYKTVGIVINESTKWISNENILEIIQTTSSHQDIIPVFISTNRNVSDFLNNLSVNPIVVEANLKSLPSIAESLDLVVTSDVALSNYISNIQSNILFVSSYESASLKNLSLTSTLTVLEYNQEINIIDLNSSILFSLSSTKLVKPILLSSNIYSSFFDLLGGGLQLVSSHTPSVTNFIVLSSREIYKSIRMKIQDDTSLIDFSKLDLNLASKYIAEQKEIISLIQKESLGAIRNISFSNENSSHANAFISNMSNLLELAEIKTSVQSLMIHLKFKINSISMQNNNTSLLLKECFYDLKEELQKVLSLLSTYEIEIQEQKKLQLNKKAKNAILTSGEGYEFISGRNESRA